MMMKRSRRPGASLVKLALCFLSTSGLLSACSGEPGVAESVARSEEHLDATQARVLGFESPLTDFSASSGTLTSSSTASQGTKALGINGGGWIEIASVPLASLGPVASTFRYDVRIPAALTSWGETRIVLQSPTLGLGWLELGSKSLVGATPGAYQTVEFPIPSTVESALEGSYSDLVIRVILNAPAASSPYLFDNIVLADATTPPTPPAPLTLSLLVPPSSRPEDVTLSATDDVKLYDRVTIGTTSTPEIALSADDTQLSASARMNGSYFAGGDTSMASSSAITGTLTHVGPVVKQSGAVIGRDVTVSSIAFETKTFELPGRTGPGSPVQVPVGGTLTLAPGSYGTLVAYAGAHLYLETGTYHVTSFSISPGALVHVDTRGGPIELVADSSLDFQGGFSQNGGVAGDFLLDYRGTSTAYVQGPFVGTLVAPNATISLQRPTSNAPHKGAFFGKNVEVASNATVLHVAFPWDLLRDSTTEEVGYYLTQALGKVRFFWQAPALAAALVEDGVTIWSGVNGVRDVNTLEPALIDDYFMLKSCTKPLTGYLAARLMAEGLIVPSTGKPLDFNTTLIDVFPEFASMAPVSGCTGYNSAYSSTTISALMSHSSGMAYTPSCEPADEYLSAASTLTGRRYLYVQDAARDPKLPPASTPYGGGSIVVAAMLERLTGTSWEALMQEYVYDELGMTNSGVGEDPYPPATDGVTSHQLTLFTPPFTYQALARTPPTTYQNEVHAPAGRNPHASILDFARFAAENLPYASHRVGSVSQAELLTSHTPAVASKAGLYAWGGFGTGTLGWDSSVSLLSHNGFDGWDHSVVQVFPTQNFATVAMTNYDYASGSNVLGTADERMTDDMTLLELGPRSIPHEYTQNRTFAGVVSANVAPWGFGYEASKAIDGLLSTRWATASGTTAATLTIRLGAPALVSRVRIVEQYHQVSGFHVDVFDVGLGNWVTVVTDTGIGPDYIARFTARTASQVRLVITSGAAPTINEMWAY